MFMLQLSVPSEIVGPRLRELANLGTRPRGRGWGSRYREAEARQRPRTQTCFDRTRDRAIMMICDMRFAKRHGSRECDMRCEYVLGRANTICDTRIGYVLWYNEQLQSGFLGHHNSGKVHMKILTTPLRPCTVAYWHSGTWCNTWAETHFGY